MENDDNFAPGSSLSDTDIRMHCMNLAAQLPLKTDEAVDRAQAFYDFVTGKQTAAAE